MSATTAEGIRSRCDGDAQDVRGARAAAFNRDHIAVRACCVNESTLRSRAFELRLMLAR
jgi:hypothetical protein